MSLFCPTLLFTPPQCLSRRRGNPLGCSEGASRSTLFLSDTSNPLSLCISAPPRLSPVGLLLSPPPRTPLPRGEWSSLVDSPAERGATVGRGVWWKWHPIVWCLASMVHNPRPALRLVLPHVPFSTIASHPLRSGSTDPYPGRADSLPCQRGSPPLGSSSSAGDLRPEESLEQLRLIGRTVAADQGRSCLGRSGS